jgi:hypothetical protein
VHLATQNNWTTEARFGSKPAHLFNGRLSAFASCAKQLQLLRELMPNVALFGVLADPAYPATKSVQIS